MDYNKDVSIDESALDIEWLEQPSLMMKYGIHRADLQLEVERTKERIEIVKAELDKSIRSAPDSYDIPKVSESAITNTILLQPQYQKAKEAYRKLKHELDYAWAASNAIDSKKSALENLVKLHGQQYFAGPKMPRELRREREIKQEDANRGVGNKLKRSK